MAVIQDNEFGKIAVRRGTHSHSMKATVAPNGTLRISVPAYAPLFMIKRMIGSSRNELRALMATRPQIELIDGMPIGKSHTLLVRTSTHTTIDRQGLHLVLSVAPTASLDDPQIIHEVRTHMQAILRKEAKTHLPKRIRYLADTHGYDYSSLRFTHASSRWGSCNSNKAISLNIALMNLPFELIDYVLIHELSHTKQLNHSPGFWSEVKKADPDYKLHRKVLKQHNPAI